jgi:hypothetical protein
VARNENPNGAASTVSEARSAVRGVRRAKKSSGSRGSATRPSRRTKPTSRTTAAIARAATSAGATERSASCVMTKTSASKPSALLPAPARSYERRAGRGGSAATTRMASSATASTTGTLTRKIQRQLSASVTSPPSTSPAANPALAHAPKTPSARLRSCPSANVVAMSETAAGTVSAAPTPCRARATTSTGAPGARPHASDIAPKSESPSTKVRRRPTRSAIRPPRSSSPP